ncbi:MAG: hypothetical protein CFE45_42915, partial [Burkholderiales bacterium PBB5]
MVIDLTGTDQGGLPVTMSTTTAASGDYRFEALAPGNYTVTERGQPTGTLDGRTLAGTGGGTASAVGSLPSRISNIALGLSQTAANNNFGEIPPASLAGTVYADNNNNGSIDTGETGLSGVAVTLTGTDDTGATVNLSGTTTASGGYTFADLRPGTYTVSEPTQPGGTVNGITTAGNLGGTATTVDVLPSAISGIVLAPGASSTANNFGEIGSSPDLRVSKSHAAPVFTANNAAAYTIDVRNAGDLPTTGSYTVSDRLPTGATLSAQPTGTGWVCTGAVGDSSFTCSSSTVSAAGATGAAPIAVPVAIGAVAGGGGPAFAQVNNAVMVEGGGEIDARRPSTAERNLFNTNPTSLPLCDPTIQHNACRDPATVQSAAAVSGAVWSDIGTTPRQLDGGDKRLPAWGVEVVDVASGRVVATTTTGADGTYRVGNLLPGVELAIRFRDPASGVVFGYPVNGHNGTGSGVTCDTATALLAGTASSCATQGANPTLGVVLAAGQELTQQSLPVDPSGVVYDSGTRQAVPGAVVTLAPVGVCT